MRWRQLWRPIPFFHIWKHSLQRCKLKKPKDGLGVGCRRSADDVVRRWSRALAEKRQS
ncbi:MAG: hypothetical protein LBU32_02490 [Clostridiales bacterium]|nr:hypothetical protein [Clostridiales bacterium]